VLQHDREKDGAIEETPNGYRVVVTGELIAYDDKRIKRSKDQFFHRCTADANPKAKRRDILWERISFGANWGE
jgi:hypothetical protein